jgi:hypothetical protein
LLAVAEAEAVHLIMETGADGQIKPEEELAED